MFDGSSYQEAEFVHNLTVSLHEPEFAGHDIHFLDHQARYYSEHAKSVSPAYRVQTDLIRQRFVLVPPELREQLRWARPG